MASSLVLGIGASVVPGCDSSVRVGIGLSLGPVR